MKDVQKADAERQDICRVAYPVEPHQEAGTNFAARRRQRGDLRFSE